MIKVKDVCDFINSVAPFDTQCEWDNCGMLVGDENDEVNKIGLALDITSDIITQCEENGVDLLVTHHPVIFRAQKSFLKGNFAYELAKRNINVISAHTCFDCADGGVNDVLAEILGLENVVKVNSAESVIPLIRMGKCNQCSCEELAKTVAEKLETTVRFGDSGRMIRNVAVCGGSAMDFLGDAVKAGADAYVTGDVDHHEMLDAMEMGICVVAAGHFETENPAMAQLKKMIDSNFPSAETVLLKQSSPMKYIG